MNKKFKVTELRVDDIIDLQILTIFLFSVSVCWYHVHSLGCLNLPPLSHVDLLNVRSRFHLKNVMIF